MSGCLLRNACYQEEGEVEEKGRKKRREEMFDLICLLLSRRGVRKSQGGPLRGSEREAGRNVVAYERMGRR